MLPNTPEIFQALAAANADLSTAMHARYMIRRFRSMGILAQYIEDEGEFSHILIPAQDAAFIEIRPTAKEVDGETIHQPLMSWVEYSEPTRTQLREKGKPSGYYRYHGEFTILLDDYDPETGERPMRYGENGLGKLTSFSHGSVDFQQFFFGAIFKVKSDTDYELYPEFRKSRVAL